MRRRPALVAPGEEVLPGYRVVALLSHGKRVDTYDVHSEDRDCRCVVKVVRADRVDEPHVREAVLTEGRVLRDLRHPHLVPCYEVHEEPVPGVVLQTLTGATLGKVLEDGPLDVADAAQLGLQLASALSYLHRAGWLHLDVKPANVVAECGRAVLIDLSLAGRPGDGRPGAGTRGYLAPEQARGEGLCPATDVWGLGVTLVESLTGELPHGDRALRALPSGCPGLLRACLDPDPAARPTLVEVRDALRPLVPAV